MPTKNILLYLFMCLNVVVLDAAKILCVFPTPAYSHQKVFRRFTEELVKRGHEVTVITTRHDRDRLDNVKEINIYNEIQSLWKESVVSLYGKQEYLRTRYKMCLIVQTLVLEKAFQNPEVRKLISDQEKIDLLVLEAWVRPIRSFVHLFKAPVISFLSLMPFTDENQIIGSPIHPTLYPLAYQQMLESQTMFEQFSEVYTRLYADTMHRRLETEENEMLRRYFVDIPSLSELSNYIEMLFLNVYPIWDTNRPVPVSVVRSGAMHLESEKELPMDLEAYLNASLNGVIYVSFGTNLPTAVLPPAGIQVMVRVLSSLPYDVLWKWDGDELQGRGANIKLANWLPQADLLRHPKIKLFVTQCGMQSTDEAIAAGVPLLGIPLLGDQWYNAQNYVKHKIGVTVELDTITENEFRDAIETIVRNESFYINMKRFQTLLRDSPQSSMERIMWWTEYMLRHGAGHIRAPAQNMCWTEYLEIELLTITIIAIFVCFITLGTCIRYFLTKFISNINNIDNRNSIM